MARTGWPSPGKVLRMAPLSLSYSVLLVVDVQRGFTFLCPAELPVPGGSAIVLYCPF